jgi:hypothetical protein
MFVHHEPAVPEPERLACFRTAPEAHRAATLNPAGNQPIVLALVKLVPIDADDLPDAARLHEDDFTAVAARVTLSFRTSIAPISVKKAVRSMNP